MVDLTTSYLGLTLKNPLVASSSPLSQKVESVQALEAAGASAVVVYSLFEEQIIHDSLKLHYDLERGSHSYAEALDYFPSVGRYSIGANDYIDHLRKLKAAVQIPVIGSLNGVSTGGWTDYARKIEQAGVDALELNLYTLATDPDVTSAELEDRYIQLVSDVRAQISIPLAVKLSPFYTALPHFARRLANVGANGLVLFNRFYQPDYDLEQLEVVPNLVLSNSNELRLPLRWIAILHGVVQADLALTSGVHSGSDLLKAMMAGAKVTTVASAFLQQGLGCIPQILGEVQSWMEAHEYESIQQMQGSMSRQAGGDPASIERANYVKVLNSY
jgi:dihydroorotate dehydrogenase (fumarate)